MKKIFIINGPNLNFLGKRKQGIMEMIIMIPYAVTFRKNFMIKM